MVVIKIDNNDKKQCKFYELSVKNLLMAILW